jgi:hypothetical protein
MTLKIKKINKYSNKQKIKNQVKVGGEGGTFQK